MEGRNDVDTVLGECVYRRRNNVDTPLRVCVFRRMSADTKVM